jgi:long-chain acyl-CoA synthetase
MSEPAWLQHYDEGVPQTLRPYPEQTLLDIVRDTARQRPDHPALIFKGTRVSYGELERLSDTFAAALAAEEVKKGDRVALLLPNCPQFVIAEFGVWKAGGIVAPLNPLYTERELEHALNESGATTVVALTPFYTKIKAAQPQTSLRKVIATNIKEYLPPVLRALFTLLKEKKEGHRVSLQAGDLWFGDLLRRYAGAPRPSVGAAPADPALILFTGGTTGVSKAAVATHHSLLIPGLQVRAWVKQLMREWDDRFMASLPLFHVFSAVGVQSVALNGRSTMVLVPNPRDLNDLLDTIQKTRPHFLPGVPTLFIALLNHPRVRAGKVDLSSIRICLSGAAPLLAATKEQFEALTGGRLIEGYALTESMMAATLSPIDGPYKPGSVGMPLPDIEVRIADPESGQESVMAGAIGEILMRAPQLMEGYWQDPAATATVIRDGWLFTGDLGYLDEDGYLFIVDRKKDLIKTSGFQVWPREVEEVIAAHPAIAEVAVAGVPDDYQGEAVKAWVVLRDGQAATAEELRGYCKERLAAYKVPKQIEFRGTLPKSMVGKVLRRMLTAEEARS